MRNAKKTNAYMRLIFLFGFFGLSIGDAFNVLYAKQLAFEIAPPGKLELFTSLPVTMMNAMMVVGVISANLMVQKKQNIVRFIRVSTIITAVGMLIRGLAFHYVILMAGFMIDGFGYGCFYIAIRYYAYLFSDDKERLDAMAVINGGSFAGQCLGTVLGGILAGQMPYRTVYLMAVALLVVPLFFLPKVQIDTPLVVGRLRDSLRVFMNRDAVVFLLFLVLPVFTCTIFVSYSVPLDADMFGYSPTVISALLLGCYMIAAYSGPFMTRLMTKRLSTLAASIIYCAAVAILIAFYTLSRSFPFLLVVVLLLGVMDSFGPSVMTDAYTKTKKDAKYSDNDALVIYILVTRIGMTMAPTLILVFGTTLVLSNIVIMGLAIFLLIGVLINLRTRMQAGKK